MIRIDNIQFLIGISRNFSGGKGQIRTLIEYTKYYKYNLLLKPFNSWVNFYEYCRFYSTLNYKNKVVVDYGADIGSSAIYFLSKGAKKVIGIEINKKAKQISKNLKFNEFDFKKRFKYTEQKYPKGDILKMDIEGAEQEILTKEYLTSFKQYIICLHSFPYSAKIYQNLENIIIQTHGKKYGALGKNLNLPLEIIYIKK